MSLRPPTPPPTFNSLGCTLEANATPDAGFQISQSGMH
ncbi:hypothetical protein BLL52_2852 [Rhodoferax antarcticus ANT.BR]|uniref:Uncharacterized protein n=1 Tax=Rhodoferax antarcticus ANT.BR TaxID=1111071 RepID=A0A1Q8YF15_9BURK|nr:hypothetical protein BLL52_2852 [Rhodoferax antarcticus ANT.BR]